MRNRLLQEYFGVDLEIIWQTIEDDLPPLTEAVTKMIEEISQE